ncbi:MAG: gst [Solirubrobacterales bacterium]|nr:gst [Solirubrobacterales bacterium]
MTRNRLITIPISHFCEKARWALDRAAIPYREERHLQAIHVAYARRAGGGRTVPVLVCADGAVFAESPAIVRRCDADLEPADRLYPAGPLGDETARLEAWLDAGLGPDSRLWMYQATLPAMAAMAPYILDGTARWEQRIFSGSRWALNSFIRRYLGVSATNAEAAMTRIDETFEQIGRRLADGRPYLCGDRFTAADVAFAALAAAVLVPPDYGSPLPSLEELPPAMATEVARLRAHPAGAFGLRVYEQQRRRVVSRSGP